jgi:hypothetical protein
LIACRKERCHHFAAGVNRGKLIRPASTGCGLIAGFVGYALSVCCIRAAENPRQSPFWLEAQRSVKGSGSEGIKSTYCHSRPRRSRSPAGASRDLHRTDGVHALRLSQRGRNGPSRTRSPGRSAQPTFNLPAPQGHIEGQGRFTGWAFARRQTLGRDPEPLPHRIQIASAGATLSN